MAHQFAGGLQVGPAQEQAAGIPVAEIIEAEAAAYAGPAPSGYPGRFQAADGL